MTLFIVVDVILRYAFNRPLVYAPEMVQILLSLVVFFGLAVCTARQGHIVMDIFVTNLPKQVQAVIESVAYFICTGLFFVITWRMFAYAMLTHRLGTETVILQIPQYLVIFVIALCCILIALLLLSQLVHHIRRATSG